MSKESHQHEVSPVALLFPGAALLGYLIVTVLLFFFGPWRYPVEDATRLVWFLVAVHVALAGGYLVGIRRRPAPGGRFAVAGMAAFCVVCSLIVLLPTSLLNTGSWIPNPFSAASDLGGAYARSLALRERATPWVNYARILVAPALAAMLPLCVFFWHRLSRVLRAGFVLATCGALALGVAMGINAEAAQFVLLFPWFVLAAHVSGARRLDPRRWAVAAVVAVLAGILLVALFATSMNVRAGSFARNGYLPGIEATLKGRPADIEQQWPDTRPAWRVAVDGLAGYLSHGYYAVYLSLREPFVPMYGVGNSVFLQRQVARLLGTDTLPNRSYPARIEARGWNAYGYWATVYPWIASDVGFPGTVVVMFVAGLVFGMVWADVVVAANPWAVAFLGQVLTFMYYVPAHNKVMHSGEGVVAFLTLGLLWAASHLRGAAGRVATR
ncbi:MAG: hypothetical protein R2752_20555 [Vicinamibacterales bacterium]